MDITVNNNEVFISVITAITSRRFVVTMDFIFQEMFACYRTFSVLRRIQ